MPDFLLDQRIPVDTCATKKGKANKKAGHEDWPDKSPDALVFQTRLLYRTIAHTYK